MTKNFASQGESGTPRTTASVSARWSWIKEIGLGASARKSYWSLADRLIVSGTNFLTVVLVGRFCGMSDLGIFALAWTILLTINVVQEALVLSPYTVFLGRYESSSQRRAFAAVAMIHHFLIVGFAALTVLSVVLVGYLLSIWQIGGLPASGIFPEYCRVGWFLLLAVPGFAFREFVRRYLFAQLHTGRVFVLDGVVAFIQILCLGLLLFYGSLSPSTALLAITFATTIPVICWFVWYRAEFDFGHLENVRTAGIKHWKFGRWICAQQLSNLATTHGINWLVFLIVGTAATGLFAACNSIVMVINPLLLGVGSVLLPRAAQANHQQGYREVNRIIWKTTAILGTAVGAMCLIIAWNGEFLTSLFFSLKPLDNVRGIVILLALANFISGISFAIDNGLMVVNRPDVNFVASMVGLVFATSFAIYLTITYGVIGAAQGVLIGALVTTLFQVVAFVRLIGKPSVFERGSV